MLFNIHYLSSLVHVRITLSSFTMLGKDFERALLWEFIQPMAFEVPALSGRCLKCYRWTDKQGEEACSLSLVWWPEI